MAFLYNLHKNKISSAVKNENKVCVTCEATFTSHTESLRCEACEPLSIERQPSTIHRRAIYSGTPPSFQSGRPSYVQIYSSGVDKSDILKDYKTIVKTFLEANHTNQSVMRDAQLLSMGIIREASSIFDQVSADSGTPSVRHENKRRLMACCVDIACHRNNIVITSKLLCRIFRLKHDTLTKGYRIIHLSESIGPSVIESRGGAYVATCLNIMEENYTQWSPWISSGITSAIVQMIQDDATYKHNDTTLFVYLTFLVASYTSDSAKDFNAYCRDAVAAKLISGNTLRSAHRNLKNSTTAIVHVSDAAYAHIPLFF